MRVRTLALEDFRGYERVALELAPQLTAFVGPNGIGKTNLLEAVHLVARGDSARARDDTEMVRWGAAIARVTALVERSEDERRLEILLFAPRAGERRRPRRYLVDGAGKRAEDALGELTVVAFFPEDVGLLGDAPAARRRYLDAMIAQVERRHRADTRAFHAVVEQRNALLRALRDEEGSGDELAFWDDELCRLSAAISLRRLRAVSDLRAPFGEASARLSGAAGCEIAYLAQVAGDDVEGRADGYRGLLAVKRDRELWQGITLVGPHREDLAVTVAGRPLPSFASRGEQRSAVLALKLAEADWLRERKGDLPVLLLDDVLSELDPARREAFVAALPADAQALVTSALPVGLPSRLLERAAIVRLGE